MRALASLLCSLAFVLAAPLSYEVRLGADPAPQLAGKLVGTYSQAVRAFGKPDAVLPGTLTRPTCNASWRRYGLGIQFLTVQAGACAPNKLRSWWQAAARARRWHTRAGLHVGDTEGRLHSLYPNARRLDFLAQGPLWELETGGLLCDGGPTLALAGQIRSGRVAALMVVHVPACG